VFSWAWLIPIPTRASSISNVNSLNSLIFGRSFVYARQPWFTVLGARLPGIPWIAWLLTLTHQRPWEAVSFGRRGHGAALGPYAR